MGEDHSVRVTPRSRRWLLIAGVALVVAIATGTWWLLNKDTQPTHPVSTSTLPASQVSLFETSLTAADPVTIEKALAPQVRAAYDRSPFPLLPPGSTVVIDAQKLTVSGSEATVPVAVTGGPTSGQWLLLLTNVDEQWLIYGTRQL
jgi:hypothetical protein